MLTTSPVITDSGKTSECRHCHIQHAGTMTTSMRTSAIRMAWWVRRQYRTSLARRSRDAATSTATLTPATAMERIQRFWGSSLRSLLKLPLQNVSMKITNLKVCHDHMKDDETHHPANKILEVRRQFSVPSNLVWLVYCSDHKELQSKPWMRLQVWLSYWHQPAHVSSFFLHRINNLTSFLHFAYNLLKSVNLQSVNQVWGGAASALYRSLYNPHILRGIFLQWRRRRLGRPVRGLCLWRGGSTPRKLAGDRRWSDLSDWTLSPFLGTAELCCGPGGFISKSLRSTECHYFNNQTTEVTVTQAQGLTAPAENNWRVAE